MRIGEHEFIELDRTFHELSQSAEHDDLELRSLLGIGKQLNWADLISHYRIVLLSEAGSGKSAQIRNTALRLRREGKPAFFVRLEHIVNGLDGAFEEGTYEEFDAWLAGDDDGWVLLYSVDEARLRDPSDFERAIRTLARALGSAKQRVHLIVTGRTTAWRPKTDLALCMQHFPYVEKAVEEAVNEDTDEWRTDLTCVRGR